MTDDVEPDSALVARASEVLAGVQSGKIEGIICLCFMDNGAINVQVGGDQNLVIRLGALVVAGDVLKLLETQLAATRAQQANWGPGGNA